jgi:hypothetical protein
MGGKVNQGKMEKEKKSKVISKRKLVRKMRPRSTDARLK